GRSPPAEFGDPAQYTPSARVRSGNGRPFRGPPDVSRLASAWSGGVACFDGRGAGSETGANGLPRLARAPLHGVEERRLRVAGHFVRHARRRAWRGRAFDRDERDGRLQGSVPRKGLGRERTRP